MAYTEMASLLNKLTAKLLEENLFNEVVLDSTKNKKEVVEDGVWSLLFMLKKLRPLVMEVQRTQSLPTTLQLMKEFIDLINEADDAIELYVTTTKMRQTESISPSSKDKDANLPEAIDSIKSKLKKWQARCPTFTASSPQIEDQNERIIGLDNEVKEIIDLLNDEYPRRDFIPIVGPGGVGKTTLARRVFHHQTTEENFPCRAWICASSEKFLEDIINQVKVAGNDDHGNEKSLEGLAIQTYKLLKNSKRYLIVFDDVWRTQFWNDINMIFPDCNPGGGGRILFTTRYGEVALNASSRRSPFYLQPPLNKVQSWELFSNRASSSSRDKATTSSGGTSTGHPWEEWANVCGGLPLAIIKLAEVDKEENREKISKEIWDLIYNSLPHYLKPCLLYLGVINSCSSTQFMELIIAEGFVQPPRTATTVQRQKTVAEVDDYDVIAKAYLNELIKRNLVEVVSKRWDGSIKEIAISKQLHLMNFCIWKAKEEKFLEFVASDQEANRVAVQWQHENYFEFKNSVGTSPMKANGQGQSGSTQPGPNSAGTFPMKARSLLFLKSTMWPSETIFAKRYWAFLLRNYTSLRVLDLFGVDLSHNDIPIDIGNLIHLRYLRLKFKEFGDIILPPSFSNLWWNLQFLLVKRSNSRLLSAEIQLEMFWRMKQLKHILCSDVLRLPELSEDLVGSNEGYLQNLQILKRVSVDCCTKNVFSRIPNLVQLGVGGSIEQGHINEIYKSLLELKRLQKLGLQGGATNDPLSLHTWEGPPMKNITHLTFKRTRLVGDTLGILGEKLPNLEILKLGSNAIVADDLYVGVTTDNKSKFLKLKCLKLEKLGIRKWNLVVGGMPSLEIVVIRNCGALQGLPSEALQKIESLRELEVYHYIDPSVETDAEVVRQKHIRKDPPLQLRLKQGTN